MRRSIIYAVLLILFAALVTGVALRKQPNCDEAWFFSPIYNFLNHGTTGTTVLDSTGMPWAGVDKYTYWQVPVYFVAEAGWMKVFGLNLLAMRSLSIVAGIIAILLWIQFFRILGFETAVVMLAAIIVATDYAMVTRSAEGRMDMLANAFGVASLIAYVKWRADSFNLSIFLSQCALMLCGLSHPMAGMVFFAGFSALFLMNGDWRRIRVPSLGLAIIPYAVGGALWGAYIRQDTDLFVRIFGSNTHGRLDGFFNPFLAVWREFYERYLGSFGLHSSIGLAKAKLVIPIIYIGAAIMVALIPSMRRNQAIRSTLIPLATMAGTMMFMDNLKYGLYLVHIFPLYSVLLAALAWFAWQRQGLIRLIAAAGLAAFVALQLAGSLYWIRRDSYHKEYLPLVHYIEQHTAPTAQIDAPAELAFEFGFEGRFKDDVNLGVLAHRAPDVIVQNDLYRSWLRDYSRNKPERYEALTERLGHFQEAYKMTEYVVFLPAASALTEPPR